MNIRLLLSTSFGAARELLSGNGLLSPGLKTKTDVLILFSAADLNVRGASGLIADKVDPLRSQLEEAGFDCLTLLPNSPEVLPDSTQARSLGLDIVRIKGALEKVRLQANLTLRRRSRSHPTTQAKSRGQIVNPFWQIILDRTEPRAIMGVGLAQGLIDEARLRAIPTLEIQHGVFAPGMRERYWPSDGGRCDSHPDLLLAWDQFFADIASKDGLESVSVGFPRMTIALTTKPTEVCEAETTRLLRPIRRYQVLVSLAWGLRDTRDPFGMMTSQLFESLMNIQDSSVEAELVLRLHPVIEAGPNLKAAKSWLTSRFPGSIVSLPRQRHILTELEQCDVNLSIASSTAFEAAIVGVPSIVVGDNPVVTWLPAPLWDLGYVQRMRSLDVPEYIQALQTRAPFEPYVPDCSASVASVLESVLERKWNPGRLGPRPDSSKVVEAGGG